MGRKRVSRLRKYTRGKTRRYKRQRGGNPENPDILANTGAPYPSGQPDIDFNVKFQPNIKNSGTIFGNKMTKSEAKAILSRPYTSWKAPAENKLYTFLCWDPDIEPPDAAGNSIPNNGYLHWLVINCNGKNEESGQQIVDWTPPSPPSGEHRYIFAIFEQKESLQINPAPPREKFNISEFTRQHNLTPFTNGYKGVRVKAT
ncbi:MAG: hypothetical protein EBU66_12985 [Bacteroidetes bacterium]|nr:hypothetical protein [bacterium]NBP65561.1 hypothetical protein [Bacteroidota bacterium]